MLLLGTALVPVVGVGGMSSAQAACTTSGTPDVDVTCDGTELSGPSVTAPGSATVRLTDDAEVSGSPFGIYVSAGQGITVVNDDPADDSFLVGGPTSIVGLYATSPGQTVDIDTTGGLYEGTTAGLVGIGGTVTVDLAGGSATGTTPSGFGISLSGENLTLTATDGTGISGGDTGAVLDAGGLAGSSATAGLTGAIVTGTNNAGLNVWNAETIDITLTDTTVTGGLIGVQGLAAGLGGTTVDMTVTGGSIAATATGGTGVSLSGHQTSLTTSGTEIAGDRGVYIQGDGAASSSTIDITETTVTADAGIAFTIWDVADIDATIDQSDLDGTAAGLSLTGGKVAVTLTGGRATASDATGIGAAVVGSDLDVTATDTLFSGGRNGISVNGDGVTIADVDVGLTGGSATGTLGRGIEAFASVTAAAAAGDPEGVTIDVTTSGTTTVTGGTIGLFASGANLAQGSSTVTIDTGGPVTGNGGSAIQAFAGSLTNAATASDQGTWFGAVGTGRASLSITASGDVTGTNGTGIEGWTFGTGSELTITSTGAVTATGTMGGVPAAGIVARSVGSGTIGLDVSGSVTAPGDGVNSVGSGSTTFTATNATITAGNGVSLTDRSVTAALSSSTIDAVANGMLLAGDGPLSTATVSLAGTDIGGAGAAGTPGLGLGLSNFTTAQVTLENGTTISSQTDAIRLTDVVGATVTVKDGAVVTGAAAAIRGGNGNLAVDLQDGGTINGDIVLGNGTTSLSFGQGATISGNIDGTGAGTSTLTFAGGGAASYGGTLSGLDSIVVGPLGGWTLTGDSSALTTTTTAVFGTLAVNGKLGGNVEVANGGVLKGGGTVGTTLGTTTVRSGGTIAPGNSIGTLHVIGDLAFEAGSIYDVELSGNGTDSDRIDVSGAVTFGGGDIIHITNLGAYDPDDAYTILTATGGVSGTFDGITSDFVFLDPDLLNEGNALKLRMSRNDIGFATVAGTPNQIASATALDGLPADGALGGVIAPLSAEAARDAFTALSGEIHASAKTALLEDSGNVRASAFARLRGAFAPEFGSAGITVAPQQAGAGDATAPKAAGAVWTHAFGDWGSTDGDGNAAGFDRSTGGFLIGADTLVAETWRLGAFGGYSRTSLDADGIRSSGDSDNYHAGLYAGTQWGPVGLRLGGAYTWHDVETSRTAQFQGFSDSLSAGYDASTAQAFAEIGYRAAVGDVALEPFADLAFVSHHTEGFTEKGGPAALAAAGDTETVTYSTLGLRAASTVALGEVSATFRGTLGWRHAFGDTVPGATLAFAGSDDFAVTSAPLSEDAAVVEAGIDFGISPDLTFGVSYTGQFGKDARDQGVRGSFAWKF